MNEQQTLKFISTKGMKHKDAPKGIVLVKYLEPCFGYFNIQYQIGYYDNLLDYDNDCGDGWRLCLTGNTILVLEYALLDEIPQTIKISQKDFIKNKFHLGCDEYGNCGNLLELNDE